MRILSSVDGHGMLKLERRVALASVGHLSAVQRSPTLLAVLRI